MLVTRLSVMTAVSLGVVANGWAKEHTADARIPPSLRSWIPWVSDSDEGKSARCPSLVGETEPACEWPARLALDLNKRGGTFRQEWTLFRAGLIDLPGDKEHWPRGIKLDGKTAPVVDFQGGPKVQAPVGQHVVTGSFLWDSLPESLAVPAETGLVALSLKGAPVRFPMRQNDGRLFLGQKTPEDASEKVEEDRVDVSVYRKLTDAVPLSLTTRLVLAVSGKSREILFARALPDGFAPTAVDSRLPARFEADGRISLQARPGQWTIDIEAHRVSLEKSVTRPVPEGLWKEGDEVWVFEAVPDLRTVSVTGVPAIDPAQTLLPEPWKAFPAYAMAPGARLDLVEEKRGNSEPTPERLNLDRALWLDSDGRTWSVHDRVVGEFTQAWRLDVDRETRLGRLVPDGLQSRIDKRWAKRAKTRVVAHLGMDAIGEHDHAGFLLGIDPQRTAGEGKVPDRAPGNQVARKRPRHGRTVPAQAPRRSRNPGRLPELVQHLGTDERRATARTTAVIGRTEDEGEL